MITINLIENMSTSLSKYKKQYIEDRLKEAENLRPFISRSEYEKVLKRIRTSNFYTVPISALPSDLVEQD